MTSNDPVLARAMDLATKVDEMMIKEGHQARDRTGELRQLVARICGRYQSALDLLPRPAVADEDGPPFDLVKYRPESRFLVRRTGDDAKRYEVDATKRIAHPDADPECEECSGLGWMIGNDNEDGADAIERCDGCLYHGIGDPATVLDEGVAPYAVASGIDCSPTYPCYVLGGGPR